MLCKNHWPFLFLRSCWCSNVVIVSNVHSKSLLSSFQFKNVNETLGEAGLNDLLLSYFGVICKISTIHSI